MEIGFFARLWAFGVAFGSHWLFWVGIMFTFEQLMELVKPLHEQWNRYVNREARRRIFLGVAAIAFGIASFQAFDEISDRLRQKQAQLNDALRNSNQQRDRKALVAQLKAFYIEGGRIVDANLPKDTTDAQLDLYKKTFYEWANRANMWIAQHMGTAASARFVDTGGIMPMHWDRAINNEHNNIINVCEQYRKNLTYLIDSQGWDDSSGH